MDENPVQGGGVMAWIAGNAKGAASRALGDFLDKEIGRGTISARYSEGWR